MPFDLPPQPLPVHDMQIVLEAETRGNSSLARSLAPFIAQAIAPIGQLASPDKTLTFCTYAESGSSDAGGNANNTFGVIRREVAEYFGFNHRILTVVDVMQFKSSLIAGPKHGTVERVGDPGNNAWEIKPTKDYVGADRAVFLIEARGRQLKVVMEFRVMDFIPQPPKDEGMPPCSEGSSAVKPVTIGFAPLGQGTLASAKPGRFAITLSPDAAGHRWFADLTPDKNKEFLPASNPNEWVARPDSTAEGKMNLLTILLQEDGHVLGFEHNHDAHDFMASTLQPGVRPTLSVDQQLELMALVGYFPVPDSPTQR